MGFRIPDAIDDDDIQMNQDGARRVAELVAGTALGAGILAAGAVIYRRTAGAVGAKKNVSDLY